MATFTGSLYAESFSGTSFVGNSVYSGSITDSDANRNGSTETLKFNAFGFTQNLSFSTSTEIVAVVRFANGETLSIKAVAIDTASAYGAATRFYLFDDASLAANGKSLSDIAQVVSRTSTDHNLNWQDLGFDATTTAPSVNLVTGTKGADTLRGTNFDDDIRGLAGNDKMWGFSGQDSFIFGSETTNRVRETDIINDFSFSSDEIVLDFGAANVRSIKNISGGVQIALTGDGDIIKVLGLGLNSSNIVINDYDSVF
jgi:hypothetical protein